MEVGETIDGGELPRNGDGNRVVADGLSLPRVMIQETHTCIFSSCNSIDLDEMDVTREA